MIPAPFEYRRARSVDEAIRLLAENDDARLLAGGHSLLPMMKLRLAAPSLLIDIGGLDELRFVRRDGDAVVVGALTRHAEVAAAAELTGPFGALAEAAAAIGDVQVRNCGTIGGSLAHADPAADYAAAVLALDAEITARGPDGERTIAAADFFAGLLTTSLRPGELLTEIRFPAAAGVSVYEKFAQPASGFAIAGVAARLELDGAKKCAGVAVAATGISDRPLRLTAVEAALAGKKADAEAIAAAAARADDGIDDVREDLYAQQDYRRHLLRAMTRRALTRAAS
ncbi:MAG TPA: xanthine dehydrogenase family protein subunit M [Acidobacteriota bacterium]